MKNKIKGLLLGTFFAAACFAMASNPTLAAVKTQNADFEIQRLPSETQVNNDVKYFDLKIAPGEREEIKMRVQNFTDHKITVKTDLRNSFTQVGGGVDFTSDTKQLDSSLAVPLTKVAHVNAKDRVLHLGPNETRDITATVKMPTGVTRGLIYGDWHFIEYLSSKGSGSAVSSNYAYSVGVVLRGKNYKVYPELKYNKTKAILYKKHAGMGIDLRNTQPMILNNVTMQAVVAKEGLFASKHIFNVTDSQIAPNSKVTLPITWSYDQLKPGRYTVNVKVTGENNWNRLPMSWRFKKHFTVKRTAAKKINQNALQQPKNKWLYVSVATGGLLLVATAELLKLLLSSGV
ncbi:DUF916 and DUF3324 domain-containing protein [Latilactobacillus graminis]|uniref:DUF3324 domain-containing protein n=2 Tax=Latilactobacillus graminis TaxID=60519 RepID=A0AA89I3Z4_9LACO|nr:DUF916 and DUF3324 domain-containing protein [Latilactobacillus graminis]KRM24472.1 hypothetical protein FC90_GL000176 [Latilactobacillus graminis DSM 20719]QFP79070.1 DUF916 and DUF3324 domain-containing protein [Latilactobacillus graminis]